MDLPQTFIETILKTYGAPGEQWLKSLEQLIKELSDLWHLSAIELMPNLSYNFVARATSAQHGPVVLKLSMPGISVKRECLALQHYNSHGAVKLLACDLERGALLLEDVVPGRSLRECFPHDDERATEIATGIIRKLVKTGLPEKESGEFLSMQGWFSPLFKQSYSEIQADEYARAKKYVQELLAHDEPYYLAHGDLHHENILEGERGWLAIDPKGVLAPKGFDVGAFIRNPMPELLDTPQRGSIIGRRLDQFADLISLDRTLLMKMSYSQAILAACWALDDQDPRWKKWLECARLIYDH